MLEINKIHLGDSYTLIKEIPDKSVDCVYTDIPYLWDSHGKGTSELAIRMEKKNQSLIDIQDGIDYSIYDDFVRVLKKLNLIIWVSRLQLIDTLKYFVEEHKCTFTILTWHKLNPSPTTNNIWLPDTEFAIHFREKGIGLNDDYFLKSTFFISPTNKDDKSNYEHPTIKPLVLVKRHLQHITHESDLVLDCFSGSGTTCVAAKELNRRFIGIEIDANYHRISVERLNGISTSGQTSIFTDFEQLELLRGLRDENY